MCPVPTGPQEEPVCPAPNDGDTKDPQNLFSLQGTWGQIKERRGTNSVTLLPSLDRERGAEAQLTGSLGARSTLLHASVSVQ